MTMRLAVLVLGVWASTTAALAQGIITTVAGTDAVFQDDGKPALQARIGSSEGVLAGPDGTVYFSDVDNQMVFKVAADGILHVVAGNGLLGFSGDGGAATAARLNQPMRLALDAQGDLLMLDTAGSRIRKVTPAGIISTVAGSGFGYGGDGAPATKALMSARGLAVDSAGNIFIADTFNNRIREITASDGIIRTIAGTSMAGSSGDGGPATAAMLNMPYALAVDQSGNIFVADIGNNRVRKITASTGVITTFAPNVSLYGVHLDSNGVLYGVGSSRVYSFTADGTKVLLAGTGANDFTGDGGKALSAALGGPFDVAPAPDGKLYIGDYYNNRIRVVDQAGIINTFAGNGQFRVSPEGIPGPSVLLNLPAGLSFDPAGNLLIADPGLNRIRILTPAGVVSTFAGTGRPGTVLDGSLAINAPLNSPQDVLADASGNVFTAEYATIRKVNTNGTITAVAGGGTSPADGAATKVQLQGAQGLAVDVNGDLLFVETSGHRARRLRADGTLVTIAGTGVAGFSGDGSPAVMAQLNGPHDLAVDHAGNIYIGDVGNFRVRKIATDGTISTVAGNGIYANPGEGLQAKATSLTSPLGVEVDAQGNMYIGQPTKISRIDVSGKITTFAGTGAVGFSGDGGPAVKAALSGGRMALDKAGDLFFVDTNNNRVRAVLAAAPAFQAAPASLSFSGTAGGSPSAPLALSVTSTVPGIAFSVAANLPPWLSVTPMSGVLPAVLQVVADPGKLAQGTQSYTLAINVPNAAPPSSSVPVSFNVGSATPPKLTVTQTSLTFTFGAQASASLQHVAVSNSGGGSLPFTSVASTSSGGNWLQLVTSSGTANPGSPVLLGVQANPGSLPPGVYLGAITITSAIPGAATNDTAAIAVSMIVSAVHQSIQLSQSGLTFTAVAGGGAVLPQQFAVLNTGQGVMNWTAATSTLSGGSWLSVSPASGSTDAAASGAPAVGVSVNAASLAAGTYYGRVAVTAAAADNSPQMVLIVLNVLAAGTNPGPALAPTSLIFTGVAGGSLPSSQTLVLGNPAGVSLSYVSGRLTLDGADWFTALAPSAALPADQATTVIVQPDSTGLTAGVYRGILTFLFTDGSSRTLNILMVLAPGVSGTSGAGTTGTGTSGAAIGPRDAGVCTPTKLLPLVSTLGQDFSVSAAWPVALVAVVVDDCGSPMLTGSVSASFTNGDPPLSLVSLKNGSWSGTWQPRNGSTSGTSISISAQIPQQSLQGSIQISGSLQANIDPPQLTPGGILSAASSAQAGVLAPGSFISIYGSRFADALNVASVFPLATELSGTEVVLGGKSLPLYFTAPGQINAIVPVETVVNTRQQLLVRHGNKYTVPEPVSVAAAQPAVFTPSQTGKGQGYVLVQTPAGAQVLADASNPAKSGDAVVIYCAGLGATNPPVVAGVPSSLTTLSPTVNPVTLTIGGQNARVLFAGLAPGFVGLYQVNAVMPASVPAGNQVSVVLTVGGQSSPPVTMSAR
jgi:uncharacterized protein (TIGR03437 family)